MLDLMNAWLLQLQQTLYQNFEHEREFQSWKTIIQLIIYFRVRLVYYI